MYRWIPYAFVRITIFYCAGIACAISCPHWIIFDITAAFCFGLILIYSVCVWRHRGRTVFAGMTAAAILISLGVLSVYTTDESRRADHLTKVVEPVIAYRAVIKSAPHERPHTRKYEIAIDQVLSENAWKRKFSKAVLYVRKDSAAQIYKHGDVVVVKGAPERIKRPLNPGEFDMEAFQRFRQIYFQSVAASMQVCLIGHEPQHPVITAALAARQWSEEAIRRNVSGTRQQGIASAFVLGVTDGLDNELMSAYAATGAMHVLSVSGLHVGIVYWLLLMILRPLGAQRLRWLTLVASLVVLWSYAFITGISAPVLRAVMMFSFAAIARAFQYKVNIYNTLAATACLLLVYDPFMIMSVGFQLSFVAVLGIVAIQPALYNLWEPTAWLWDECWKICSVSIAAQLATLPLCLVYFHQFPNYFLITNLFIVPGSFLVLVAGIVLLAVSAFDVLAHAVGWLLEWLIDILNSLIFVVEHLPYSVVENIFITPLQAVVMALAMVAVLVWTVRRSPRWLAVSGCLLVAFPIASWATTLQSREPTITVYAVSGTVVDLIADRVTITISTEEMSGHRAVLPNRIARRSGDRVVQATPVVLQPGCDLYCWKGRSIIRIHQPLKHPIQNCTPDFVIISNNAVRDVRKLSQWEKARYYVVDGSNSRLNAARLERQGEELDINVYNVMRKGAFNESL